MTHAEILNQTKYYMGNSMKTPKKYIFIIKTKPNMKCKCM